MIYNIALFGYRFI